MSHTTASQPAAREIRRVAIYPGSFDPLTNGHVDIITRGAAIFDRIIVGILNNREKSPLFSVKERVEMAEEVFAGEPRVAVLSFDGLLVDFARQQGAQVIVRGLRAISDFEYEFQMALMNRRLVPDLETVFMMPAEAYTYISSRLIREVFALGGPIAGLVPDVVEAHMHARQQNRDRRF
jgi:pantetheine-phosphate adenylyltransferase